MNYSEGHIRSVYSNMKKFEMYLSLTDSTANPYSWTQETFETYYAFLKTYRFKKADNRKTGYLRNKADRKYISRPLSKVVIAQHMDTMKNFMQYLLEHDKIYTNPFDKVEFKYPEKSVLSRNVTRTDISGLVSVIDTYTYLGYRNRTIIELIYGTGLRLFEISMLNIQDIDFKESSLIVRKGKGRKGRIVPLGEVALSYVREYISAVRKYLLSIDNRNETALFLNNRGNRLFSGSICRIVREYSRTAGLYHITTHKLRHAFSLHMLRQGCDIRYIQEILGHVDLKTTTIYTQIFDKELKEKIQEYHPRDHELQDEIDIERIRMICNKLRKKV